MNQANKPRRANANPPTPNRPGRKPGSANSRRLARGSMSPYNPQNVDAHLPELSLERAFRSSLDEGLKYVQQLVIPETCKPQRVPDNVTSASAVFAAPFIRNLDAVAPWDPTGGSNGQGSPLSSYDGTADGTSTALIFPGTRNNIWISNGTDVSVSDEKDTESILWEPMMVSAAGHQGQTSVYVDHAFHVQSPSGSFGIVPRKNANGVPIYPVTMTSGTACLFRVGFRWRDGNSVGPYQLQMTAYGSGSTVTTLDSLATDATITLSFAATSRVSDLEGFSIQIAPAETGGKIPESAPVITMFQLAADDIAVSSGQYNSCCYSVLDTPGLGQLDETNGERTTALSALVTYMGAELSNGGTISWARLPVDYPIQKADEGDYYGFLARQPFYADDYPLKVGCYSFWAPDSLEEYFYIPYGQSRSKDLERTACLAMSMNRDDPTQDVRLKVLQHIEALTRSVTYVAEVGQVNILFPEIMRSVKELPAGCENKTHTNFFSRALAKLKSMFTTKKGWLSILGGVTRFVTGV